MTAPTHVLSHRLLALSLTAILVGGLLAASCQNRAPVAPTDATILLSSTSQTIGTGGQTKITAVVLDSTGKVVDNGTIVYFQTTLGTMNPAQARTADGRATTQLVAPAQTGTATVTALSGTSSSTLDVTIGQ